VTVTQQLAKPVTEERRDDPAAQKTIPAPFILPGPSMHGSENGLERTQLDIDICPRISPTIAITTAPPTPPSHTLDSREERSRSELVPVAADVDVPPEASMLSN
jgi:hypothetical protein